MLAAHSFPKFVPVDSSNGFIVKDSLIVEVEFLSMSMNTYSGGIAN